MSMKFHINPDDFLKGQLVTMGWHPSQIVNYSEEISPAKTDERGKYIEASTYIQLQYKITDGDFKGVVLFGNYSEKAQSMIVPVLEALGAKFDKTKAVDLDLSKEKFLGKTLDIHVVRGTFAKPGQTPKPKNEIDGYKPYSGKGAVVLTQAQAGV